MHCRTRIDQIFEVEGLRFHVVVSYNQGDEAYDALLSKETRPDCQRRGAWRVTIFEPYQGVLEGITHVNFDLEGEPTMAGLMTVHELPDILASAMEETTGETVRGVELRPGKAPKT